MKNLIKYTAFLLIIAIFFPAYGKNLNIKDFDILPYSFQNSTEKIQIAISECKKQNVDSLIFPAGRYDIWPEGAIRKEFYISNTSSEQELASKIKTIGIFLDSMSNLTIEGNGATLMFHGSMTPIAINCCNNIKLHNLHIDFERPGGSEFTVLDVQKDFMDVKFHKDSKWAIDNEGKICLYGEGWRAEIIHCVEYEPETGRYCHSGLWGAIKDTKAIDLGDNKVRFMVSDAKTKTGHTITLRDIIRREVGTFIHKSNDITLDSIFMQYMHGLGIISQRSGNITMQSVRCAPSEESGRVLASSADFMHFSGCKGFIHIYDCYYRGAHDDCVNIHGTDLRAIGKIGDNTLKVRFMHGQSYGFEVYSPGDSIAFLKAATMERTGYAIVESLKRLNPYEIEVTLDKKIPADFVIGEDCLENYTYTPTVDIKRNYFSGVSTRGILLTSPKKIVVSDNTFTKTAMAAILIEGDAKGWFECGTVKDVLITNNKFIDCNQRGACIIINPSNSVIDPKKPVHSNIRITNNYFDLYGMPLIKAKSTSELVIKNNTIINPAAQAVILEGCSKTEIQKIK